MEPYARLEIGIDRLIEVTTANGRDLERVSESLDRLREVFDRRPA